MSSTVLTTTSDGGRHDVLDGALTLPVRGVWQARLELDASSTLAGAVQLTLARDDGATPQVFSGTIVRTGYFSGRAKVIVAGGAGGLAGELAVPLAPRHYEASPNPPSAALLFNDILADAGETMAPGVAAALSSYVLPRWLRARALGRQSLSLLADRLGLQWRMRPDGTVWIGTETWPAAPDVTGLYTLDDDGFATVLEAAPAAVTVVPGMSFQGRNIREAVFKVGGQLRAELYTAESLSDLWAAGAGPNALAALYASSVGATVRARRSDDSVDLDVDGSAFGSLNAVPVRVGIRARVLLEDNDRVRLRFENADPASPYVAELDRDAGATLGVAYAGGAIALPFMAVANTMQPGTFVLVPCPTSDPSAVHGIIISGSQHTLVRST